MVKHWIKKRQNFVGWRWKIVVWRWKLDPSLALLIVFLAFAVRASC
jgi:hypothetical protein